MLLLLRNWKCERNQVWWWQKNMRLFSLYIYILSIKFLLKNFSLQDFFIFIFDLFNLKLLYFNLILHLVYIQVFKFERKDRVVKKRWRREKQLVSWIPLKKKKRAKCGVNVFSWITKCYWNGFYLPYHRKKINSGWESFFFSLTLYF